VSIHQRSRKELRIESMLPDIEEKNISFNRNHRELLSQFERYGGGKSGSFYDDSVDSMEMALSVLKKGTAKASIKAQWM
jgi:predicted phage terminase large subunit-like protein